MKLSDEHLADVAARLDDPKCHECDGRGRTQDKMYRAITNILCGECEGTGFFALSLDTAKEILAELIKLRALRLTDDERAALQHVREQMEPRLPWGNPEGHAMHMHNRAIAVLDKLIGAKS